MENPQWVPNDIPLDRPSAARMYDYFLGGHHNFEIDRIAAEQVIAAYPDSPLVARTNRAFLRRAVKYLGEQGIDQFLDIGSGIPTVGNVHDVAQKANTAARVVYVDNDPIAVQHSQAILHTNPQATIIQADARHPEQILQHPEVLHLLDFTRPIGVLLIAVLHFVANDTTAAHIVGTLRDSISSDSFIALSHATFEGVPPAVIAQSQQLYARSTNPLTPRSRAQIATLFAGLELVEPGLVHPPQWRPESVNDLLLDQPTRTGMFAGVGRKP